MNKFNLRGPIVKTVGYALVIGAVVLFAYILIANRPGQNVPTVFSTRMLNDSIWERYKAAYLEPNTYRTVDTDRGGITTSEGEGYTLLRAAWLDDRDTFDKSWKWTSDNIKWKNGDLFSWLFGKHKNGTYGVLTEQNGQNTASDADSDIALAMTFAYARWQDPTYLDEAKKIIPAIWDQEVVTINGKPYLTADNLEKNSQTEVLINPSYLSPYAYRIFATLDPKHDWNALVDSSYSILDASMSSTLGGRTGVGLPPNWIAISRTTGAIRAAPGLDADYSYDALRVPWRVALDWEWYKEPRAKATLEKMSLLDEAWSSHAKLDADYHHDGMASSTAELPAMYAGSLGALMVINPAHARQLYRDKLQSLYDPDIEAWRNPIGYYNENWVWFGMALYNSSLPNLWAEGLASRAR